MCNHRAPRARYLGLKAISHREGEAVCIAFPYAITTRARTSREALAFALILGESLRRRSSRA